jgi:hypothetical protein
VRPPASGRVAWQTGSPHVEYHRRAVPPELPEPPLLEGPLEEPLPDEPLPEPAPDELPPSDPLEPDVLEESVAASAPCLREDGLLHPMLVGSNTPAVASADRTIRPPLPFIAFSLWMSMVQRFDHDGSQRADLRLDT